MRTLVTASRICAKNSRFASFISAAFFGADGSPAIRFRSCGAKYSFIAFARRVNECVPWVSPEAAIWAAFSSTNSATAAMHAGCARPASMICSRRLLPSHFAASAPSRAFSSSSARRLSSELMSAIMPRVSSRDQSLRYMKPGSTPFVFSFSRIIAFESERFTLIPVPSVPRLIWSSIDVAPAARIVLRFFSPVASMLPAGFSKVLRLPSSFSFSPFFSSRSCPIAASMRRAAAADRSSGLRHAARSVFPGGSSHRMPRTAFASSSDSSIIFGELSSWRLSSPM